MTEKRVLLDAAAFLDSSAAAALAELERKDVREIASRFLSACYLDLGKAPCLLDGDEMGMILRELLPRRFGVRDPLAGAAPSVLRALLEHVEETHLVPRAFEIRRALEENEREFLQAVADGRAHRDGVAILEKGKPFVHRVEKTGRNDPCPCGSGKKFKKCCGR
ncbi:MAG: hypothetical protein Fur0037_18480 [Planctomycetota bacterium]